MLATKKSTKKGSAPRSGPPGASLLSAALRRVGAFALARPGTVALMLLFTALGAAVSANALWMQSDRHPAPLFRQASFAPQHAALTKKAAETASSAPASASSAPSPAIAPPAPQDGDAALPPPHSAPPARAEAGSPTPAKPQPAKHAERDPLADLIGGAAGSPPSAVKASSPKQQTSEKPPHPSAQVNDAIAGLIEQSAKPR